MFRREVVGRVTAQGYMRGEHTWYVEAPNVGARLDSTLEACAGGVWDIGLYRLVFTTPVILNP